jgi:transcriptional regulator with XRE-family HTH domain
MNENEPIVRSFLKQWRTFRDLTQEQLAEMVGLTAPAISQLETGVQWFSAKSLAHLCKALQCTPADLLGYDPSRPDSFWPLFQAAERLEGRERQRIHAIMSVVIDQARSKSK